MTRRANVSEPRIIQATGFGDRVLASLHALHDQLRSGVPVELPDILLRLLPDEAEPGDRVKVDEWRSFVLWAEWGGDTWRLIVYQDGKPRKTRTDGAIP
jgi:hypothetical protein